MEGQRTSLNQSTLALWMANTVAEPTIRPPKERPTDAKRTQYGPTLVNGSIELSGGAAAEIIVVVVRSKPA